MRSAFAFIQSGFILLGFLLVGKTVAFFSGLPIPGAVIGLILLFIALNLRLIHYKSLEPATNFLLSHMTLFFVPVGVGLIQYTDLLSQHWLAILVSSAISTLLVLVIVGWCYQRLAK